MSWSTDLFCNIHFNRETFDQLYQVQNAISETKACIDQCKKELHSLAIMTEPAKFYNKDDYDSPYSFIEQTFQDNIDLLEEYIVKLDNLLLLEDKWNKCHDEKGLAIPPPDNIHWDSAFLDGDFVKTVNSPNGE